ncbi:hypothetical protein KI387_019556, partial [Taxus chinensis]
SNNWSKMMPRPKGVTTKNVIFVASYKEANFRGFEKRPWGRFLAEIRDPCKKTQVGRQFGKELKKEPKVIKNGDAGFFKMIPTKPMVMETFSEYPPLVHFFVRDMHQTIVVEVIKAVEKKEPSSAKGTKVAATKK